jgi:hypothetical protein
MQVTDTSNGQSGITLFIHALNSIDGYAMTALAGLLFLQV